MILCSICTLIFVSGGRGDARPVTCTCASSGVQEVVVWTAFTSACHSEGSIFGPEKVKKNYARKYGPPQFKIPATDAVCVKVASSLTFCAHSSLQSFSTSNKMKGPKTGPPGGTTFDPKRVHFWVPSEIYLLCARVQNWALSILNLVPPWGLV